MRINISKMEKAYACWRLARNQYLLHVPRDASWGMSVGSAFHKGIAVSLATGDFAKGKQAAQELLAEDAPKLITPGLDDWMLQQQQEIVDYAIFLYSNLPLDYQVVQPECKFSYALPYSAHNDPFIHWYEVDENENVIAEKWDLSYFGRPDEDGMIDIHGEKLEFKHDRFDPIALAKGRIRSPHQDSIFSYLKVNVLGWGSQYTPTQGDISCLCHQSHLFNGITDSLVMYGGMPWILEHKTDSRGNDDNMIKFSIEIQVKGYCLAIWRTLGIRPRGGIVTVIYKPSERMIESWNKRRTYGPNKTVQDYMRPIRDMFPFEEHELVAFEKDLRSHCDEWVRRLLTGDWAMTGAANEMCIKYNRTCAWFSLCKSSDDLVQLETYK